MSGNLGAGLGVMRATAGSRELCHHDLVDERDVDLDIEDVTWKLNRTRLVAIGRQHVNRARLGLNGLGLNRLGLDGLGRLS
jgi:hypothetical protein